MVYNNHSYEETRWRIMGNAGRSGAAAKANRDYVSYPGDPDVDFTRLASAYNIPGAVVKNTDELQGAIKRGLKTLADGRPFVLDVHTRPIGVGTDAWRPKFSVAELRTRKV